MRCPVCRAENDVGPQCRRCRADLGLLFALEDRRRLALNAAYHLLHDGEFRRALEVANGICALRDDAEARRLAAGCALLCRDFASAWREFREYTDAEN